MSNTKTNCFDKNNSPPEDKVLVNETRVEQFILVVSYNQDL